MTEGLSRITHHINNCHPSKEIIDNSFRNLVTAVEGFGNNVPPVKFDKESDGFNIKAHRWEENGFVDPGMVE